MSMSFHRNHDGTTTGRNDATGFTVTHADEEEVKKCLYQDAGWAYTPPPPPVPPGHHRFSLADGALDSGTYDDARHERLRENPPAGCVPVDSGRRFALECERPGSTLLDAVTNTVAEIRREYGLVPNSLGIERPDEWLDSDNDSVEDGNGGGRGAEVVAQQLLAAVHRAALLGYGRADLVRLLDATGIK